MGWCFPPWGLKECWEHADMMRCRMWAQKMGDWSDGEEGVVWRPAFWVCCKCGFA